MAFELQFLDLLQKLHTPFLDSLMVFVSRLGDKGFIWILIPLILLLRKQTRPYAMLFALALCIDFVCCNLLLKPLVARVRPFDVRSGVTLLISAPTDFSFPSGHTAASFASVTAAFLCKQKKSAPALLLISLLALLIAFSRMYLYVHYPTDILAGIAVGCFSAVLAARLLRAFRAKAKPHR